MLMIVSCMFMFYFGILSFFMLKKHVLCMLLSLEFLSLVVLLVIIYLLMGFCYDKSIIIYFIIVMVCEAVMGLILLTLMVRTHGNDYSKSLVVFMC